MFTGGRRYATRRALKRGRLFALVITLLHIFPLAAPVGAQDALSAIGRKVWQNECAGSIQGLVSWNAGEDFPSLGIGHFIWYPAGKTGPFDESFPKLMDFATHRGVQVPTFFRGAAPWRDRASFMADRSGVANQMRQWLARHLDLQVQFLVARCRAALPSMLRVARDPVSVKARFAMLSRSPLGLYCLVDYVNFKGEGTKLTERYNGQGWGLLQVLEEMRGSPSTPDAAAAEFSRAAAAVMTRRVKNSPPARGESRWLNGWLNRCRSYAPTRRWGAVSTPRARRSFMEGRGFAPALLCIAGRIFTTREHPYAAVTALPSRNRFYRGNCVREFATEG